MQINKMPSNHSNNMCLRNTVITTIIPIKQALPVVTGKDKNRIDTAS